VLLEMAVIESKSSNSMVVLTDHVLHIGIHGQGQLQDVQDVSKMQVQEKKAAHCSR